MSISAGSFRRLCASTVVWSLVFAAAHFYWAAEGDLGIGDAPGTLAASLYVACIAVLGLFGAEVARRLGRGRRADRRLHAVARVGGAVLMAGVAFGVARWVADGSLGDDGAGGVVITAYFLVGGLLFSGVGWGAPRATGARLAQ
jgi:hypothetical protein